MTDTPRLSKLLEVIIVKTAEVLVDIVEPERRHRVRPQP
jgi:hypothetical protein